LIVDHYNQTKKYLLYSPYYAEACNEFVVPNSATAQGNTATFVDVEAATLCKIWPVLDLTLRPTTLGTLVNRSAQVKCFYMA